MASPTEPPPNFNCFRSWLAVAGASSALFCTVGFLNAFGFYQEYYKTTLLKTTSTSDISWIGSIAIFLAYVGSPIVGPLLDKLGPFKLVCTGTAVQLAAVFLSSICTKFWHFILAQSVFLGLGVTLIFTPALSVPMRRVPHHVGLATGIVVGGSSIGGIIWPIMLDQLLHHNGLSFTLTQRYVGATMTGLLLFACATLLDARVPTASIAPLEHQDATEQGVRGGQNDEPFLISMVQAWQTIKAMLTDVPFALFCLGMAIAYLGLFTPFFYISTYAVEKGIHSSTAFYLISAINASSFFGRVIPGYVGDKYGHFSVCILAMLVSGIVASTWTTADSLAGITAWSIAYGFTSGAIIGLQPICARKFAGSEKNAGTAVGLAIGAVSGTALIGTPISGRILSRGGYLGLGLWSGLSLLIGSVILAGAMWKLNGRTREKRTDEGHPLECDLHRNSCETNVRPRN